MGPAEPAKLPADSSLILALLSYRSSAMILPVLTWIGFFSMLSQVLLMRELLVSFEGNELSLGIVLAAWLTWTGIGSAAWGRVARKKYRPALLAGLLALSGLVFPLTVVAAGLLPLLVEQIPGELAGPSSLVYPFLILLPLGLLSGGLFPAASSVLTVKTAPARATGRVYLLEAVGGGVAGIAASFLLTGVPTLSVAVILSLGSLFLAGCLLTTRWRLLLAAALVAGCVFVLRLATYVEQATLRSLWKGYHVVETFSSPYGKLALVEVEGEPIVFHNRVVLFGAADEQSVEEKIHYPLLAHPAPVSVLLLGGGSPSALVQVLKHKSVRHLDYLEADPALIALFQRHFTKEWRKITSDRRARVHQTDPRRFVRSSNGKWDVIIVGLPPPRTVLMNRYYTLEFFQEAKKVLSPGGMIALQLPGSENYISGERARFLACIRRTLSAAFERVAILPGSQVQLFASRGTDREASADPLTLMARVKERQLDAMYVREYLIPFRLTPDRVLDLDRQTQSQPDTPINRDFAPTAYYLEFILWGSIFGETYRRLFLQFAQVPYWVICVGAALLVMLPLVIGRFLKEKDSRSRAVEACVGAIGLTMLGLQVVLLLGFQACYGFLYQQLGMLTGAFMFGMACGAFFATRTAKLRAALTVLQLLVCAWLVVVYLCFEVAVEANSPLIPYLLFAGLSLVTGLLGGWHFVVASSAWLANRQGRGSLGAIYAIDLIGAAFGAILVAAFLLPVFGYAGTAGVLAVMNLAAVGMFVVSSRSDSLGGFPT